MATTSIQPANLFTVDGLVAVVTGGGSGIGLMIARSLALNGAAKVYIVGRRKEVLEKAAATVSTGNIIPLVGDVTSKDDLQAAVDKIKTEVGYVNLVVANSGVGGPQVDLSKTPSGGSSVKDFQQAHWTTSFEDTVKTFEVNTAAVFFTAIAFLELLDEGNKKGNVAQRSQFITTSSIAGFNRKAPGGMIYGLSKSATTHLVKMLATNLVPFDIRSNAIAPGLYPSDMGDPIIAKFNNKIEKDLIPLQRVGTEEDMAGAILFLASRAGAYCNGHILLTDGGRLSTMPTTY